MARLKKKKKEGAEWLSPEDVAEVLGCTRSWAFELVKDNRIKSKEDPLRGKSRPYRIVYILDLEDFIVKTWEH